MLTLRREQMVALQTAAARRLGAALARRMSARFPRRTLALEPEGTLALCEDGVARALAAGIDDAGLVGRFVTLLFGVDPELGRRPGHGWVRQILDDRTIDGDLKIRLLEEALEERGRLAHDSASAREA
jgi:hypothetical protein